MSNPVYRPPEDAEPPDDSRLSAAEWRYVGSVFLGTVAGLSVLTGMIDCLRGGELAARFGAEHLTAVGVALGALRIHGAGAVLSAAAVALVAAVHRRSWASAAPPQRGMFWPALVALPIAAPIAGSTMAASAVAVASLAFGVPAGDSWTSIRSLVLPEDALVGAAVAALFGAALGAAAPALGRLLAGARIRLVIKIVLALVVTQGTTAVVNAVWSAVSAPSDSQAPGSLRQWLTNPRQLGSPGDSG